MVKLYKPKPLWNGPRVDGITQSLLNKFIACRERFRLQVVEGIVKDEDFVAHLVYGNMWHLCQESDVDGFPWLVSLTDYRDDLCKKHKNNQIDIEKWYQVCKIQYPIYKEYWKDYKDEYESLSQEEEFKITYKLPSKRIVTLRGKFDEILLKEGGLYLGENKSKGAINEDWISTQILFDLQTTFYLVALRESKLYKHPLKGIRYNAVRRPLSGGKGTIKQKKGSKNIPAETKEEYYGRVKEIIERDKDTFFKRWECQVYPFDLVKFERTFLIPILEQLCDWWEHIEKHPWNPWQEGQSVHWRLPYGVWNPTAAHKPTVYDKLLDTQSTLGLTKTDTLFPELS